MLEKEYDIVLLSDFRFSGGTSSAVAEEIKAHASFGYRTALVHLEAPNLTYPFPVHAGIRNLVESGLADMVQPGQPVRARLALVHNPLVLTGMPHRPLNVRAEIRLLVVQHPPMSGTGAAFYDAGRVRLHADEILDGSVTWAPVGPRVRTQCASMPEQVPLHPEDWYNIIDAADWAADRKVPRDRFRSSHAVIGRHSRPDRRKWPDTREETLQAYPDAPDLSVRVLGGGPFLRDLVGTYPRNWKVWRFNTYQPKDFLQSLDFFVYYHHSDWVEAFGCCIIEALASGVVAILPPHFEELFGAAAVYARPADVTARIRSLYADRPAYEAQVATGRDVVARRFSPAAHIARIGALIGPPKPRQVAAAGRPFPPSQAMANTIPGPRSTRRLLFISSNGVGMGHLTRLLAIARRCPDDVQPVFATLSQGMPVVTGMGYLAEYLPDHRYLDCDISTWNRFLRRELDEMIRFYDARVVLFDCNCPYQGLIDAAGDNPDRWCVWCRRGMWRRGAGEEFIRRERHFQAVLEPRDLAGALDQGLTVGHRQRTRLVDPIRLLDDHELVPREVARRELGLDLDRPAILLLLGSENNFDFRMLRRLIVRHLRSRGGLQIAVGEWMISNRRADLPEDVTIVRGFPFARWLHAFDGAVSAVGYNSFHELIYAGVPAVFVPNENPKQDDQLARALYAERHGLGYCLRTSEIYRVADVLDGLLDPDERAAIRSRCAALGGANGAQEAARMVAELSFVHRADRTAIPLLPERRGACEAP